MMLCGLKDVARIAGEIHNMQMHAKRQFTAIYGDVINAVGFMKDRNIQACFGGAATPDFSMAALVRPDQPCNIYVMFPWEYLDQLAPLSRLIFGVGMLYKQRHPSAPRVTYCIDEASQLRGADIILRSQTVGRGAGIRVWTIWQDFGQIIRNFDREALQTFLGSSQFRQFFGVRDFETAQLISGMLGDQTLEYDETLKQDEARRAHMEAAMAMMYGDDPLRAGYEAFKFAKASAHRTKQQRPLMTPG